MSEILKWNTRRCYSEHGQRIVAKMFQKKIVFVDVDRGIFGTINNGAVFAQYSIMNAYDNGNYDCGLNFDIGFGFPELHELEAIGSEMGGN